MSETMTGTEMIAAERQRQIDVEGYTANHDVGHANELLAAAWCYLTPEAERDEVQRLAAGGPIQDRGDRYRWCPRHWPWHPDDWKPTPDDRRRELIKAGALIAAALDALKVALDETEATR